MPGLPTNPDAPWPPKEWEPVFKKLREWSAWYSSDPDQLADVYAHRSSVPSTRRRWFWTRVGTKPETAGKAQLHVPIAADLASTSAALVFAEEPEISIAEAHLKRPGTGARKAEDRLTELVELGDVYSRLIESAEVASGLGGVYLHPVWDRSLAPVPLLGVTHPDSAIPEFQFGVLRSVVFWTEEELEGNDILRHMEYHQAGDPQAPREADRRAQIHRRTYRTAPGKVGNPIGETQVVVLPFEELDVQYVPAGRPNRLWRDRSEIGMSAYAGSESVLDAIDETYASWMRDVRLAKARIIVPYDYLDPTGDFDVDMEAFTPLRMDPGYDASSRAMIANQFEIRAEAHLKTILELIERTVNNAGFSPQTFGLRIEGRAESGIALRIRENKTSMNMLRRGHWWRTSVSRILRQLQAIDHDVFEGPDPREYVPSVKLSDKIVDDPKELAETANQLKQAQAASIRARVKLSQPDLEEDEVEAEVERIKEEEQIGIEFASPDPSTMFGGGLVTDDEGTEPEE